MKTIRYDEWLKRAEGMKQRAQLVLRYFDRSQLKRKKRSATQQRPSRRTRIKP